MLRSIRLTNFKSHAKTEVAPKLITAFIGPNNGGKSAIFHALQLLKQVSKSGQPQLLIPQKPSSRTTSRGPTQATPGYPNIALDVGEFSDLIKHGQRTLGIGFDGDIVDPRVGRIDVTYDATFMLNELERSMGRIKVEGEEIRWDYRKDRGGQVTPSAIKVQGIVSNFSFTNQILNPIYPSGRSYPPDSSSEDQARAADLLNAFGSGVHQVVTSVNTAYGIRGFEEYAYHVADYPTDFDYLLLDDRALAISTAFPYNRLLEERTSAWLERLLGFRIRFEMVGQRRVVIRTERGGGREWNLIVNEGLGLHQLIFMLLPIATAPIGGTVLLEEPEAHLHPKAQATLSEFLVKTAVEDQKQLLLATHSEHILTGFLAAIRHQQLSMENLAIFYVESSKDGTSSVTPLEFDNQGRVQGGLPGFFDQNAKELLDLLGGTVDKREAKVRS